MNRAELVETFANAHGLSRADAGRYVGTLVDTVVNTLRKGDSVTIQGFGTFKVSARAARVGRNPKTGEPVKIAAVKLPKFLAGSAFKAAVDPKAAARKAAKKASAEGAAVPAKKAAAKKVASKKAAPLKAAAKKAPAKKAPGKAAKKAA